VTVAENGCISDRLCRIVFRYLLPSRLAEVISELLRAARPPVFRDGTRIPQLEVCWNQSVILVRVGILNGLEEAFDAGSGDFPDRLDDRGQMRKDLQADGGIIEAYDRQVI